MTNSVSRAAQKSRFEARVDGEMAGFLDFIEDGDRLVLTHTEVLPAFGGQGVAGDLVEYARNEAKSSGLKIVPKCSSVAAYLAKRG